MQDIRNTPSPSEKLTPSVLTDIENGTYHTVCKVRDDNDNEDNM